MKIGKNIIQENFIVLLLIVSVFLGLFLRLWNAGALSFIPDEALSARAAVGILERGYPSYITIDGTIIEYSKAYLHSMFLAISYRLFGITTLATRLPGIIWGTILIPISYFFGKEFSNKKVGLILAFIVAIYPWQISTARYTRYYSQFQVIFVIALFAFYIAFKKFRKTKNEPLTAISNFMYPWGFVYLICVLGAYYTYVILFPLITIPIWYAFLTILLDFFKEKKRNYRLILLFLVIIPILIAFLYFTKGGYLWNLMGRLVFSPILFEGEFLWIIGFLNNRMGIFFIISIIGLIFYLLKKGKDSLFLIFSSVLTSFIIGIGVLMNPWTHYRYVSPLLPFILFFVAYFIYQIFAKLYKTNLKGTKRVFCPIIGLMLLIGIFAVPISQTWEISTIQPDPGRTPPFSAYHLTVYRKGACSFVLQNAAPEDIVYLSGEDWGNIFYLRYYEFDKRTEVSSIRDLNRFENLSQLQLEVREEIQIDRTLWFIITYTDRVPSGFMSWIKEEGEMVWIGERGRTRAYRLNNM